MQKALRIKGFNTMTRYIDDDITGGARFAMNASNIAKRMGTGAVIFGAADAIGGGPYNLFNKNVTRRCNSITRQAYRHN